MPTTLTKSHRAGGAYLGRLCATLCLTVIFAIGNVTACGSSGDSGDGSSNGNSSGNSNSGGFGNNEGGTGEVFSKIVVTPADAVINVDLNAKTPVTEYSAKGIRGDGTEVQLTGGTWNFSRIDAAGFEVNKLVPTGFIGGKGVVTFTTQSNQSGSTSAMFKLRIVVGTPPPQNVIDAFNNATENDGVMSLVYPYDKTVFPRGLPSPIVQWNGNTGDADIYKISATSDTFDYVHYTTVPKAAGAVSGPGARYSFPTTPADIWAKLTDSTVGNAIINIQRWDGAKAYKAKTQTWGIAAGNLKGSIYYTRLVGSEATGQTFLRRIQPGKTGEAFLVSDPTKPAPGCIACHSVSKDGSRIVAGLNGGASPWATYDTATGKELYRSSQASGFEAISANGQFVLWRHWVDGAFNGSDGLILSAYNNDAQLAKLTLTGTTGFASHPAWSPDEKQIAFAVRTAGDGLNFTASTLWTTDVTLGATPGFANTKKIIDGNATYQVVTYPTWSPDSKWISFMRANQSRSNGNGKAELWISSSDGATQIRLDAANGVPDVSATPDASWGPSMHPVAAGGYFWVAFFSRRIYGNTFNGANRQLWLAAIDANPTAGKDPSHPAFYVAGQENDSTNERPQFTVNPCKPLGETCENGYDCCDGYCRADASGKLVCQNKGNQCAQDGDKCSVDADCCDGSRCIGGFCSPPAPK